MRYLVAKFLEARSGMPGAGGRGKGFNGDRVSVWENENVREMGVLVMVAQHCEYP